MTRSSHDLRVQGEVNVGETIAALVLFHRVSGRERPREHEIRVPVCRRVPLRDRHAAFADPKPLRGFHCRANVCIRDNGGLYAVRVLSVRGPSPWESHVWTQVPSLDTPRYFGSRHISPRYACS